MLRPLCTTALAVALAGAPAVAFAATDVVAPSPVATTAPTAGTSPAPDVAPGASTSAPTAGSTSPASAAVPTTREERLALAATLGVLAGLTDDQVDAVVTLAVDTLGTDVPQLPSDWPVAAGELFAAVRAALLPGAASAQADAPAPGVGTADSSATSPTPDAAPTTAPDATATPAAPTRRTTLAVSAGAPRAAAGSLAGAVPQAAAPRAASPKVAAPKAARAAAAPALRAPAADTRSCSELKAAGYANIKQGHFLYRADLDRDGNGIACEDASAPGYVAGGRVTTVAPAPATAAPSTGQAPATVSSAGAAPAAAPAPVAAAPSTDTRTCKELEDAGMGNFRRSDPLYSDARNADGDGLACENETLPGYDPTLDAKNGAPAAASGQALAYTGAPVAPFLGASGALMGVGTALVVAGRRVRRAAHRR